MPQFGVLVYMPTPADPMALDPAHLELLDSYPARAAELGGKVLGGSYFPGQRGFAFDPSTEATAVRGGETSVGPVVESDLVPAAFFVLSAPSLEVAVRAAQAHPAARDGGVEVRKLFAPATEKAAKA